MRFFIFFDFLEKKKMAQLFLFCFFLLFSISIGYKNNKLLIYSNNQWNTYSSSLESSSSSSSEKSLKFSTNWKEQTTEIFIFITNFLDSNRCSKSLYNYLSKAKYPQRIKFGKI